MIVKTKLYIPPVRNNLVNRARLTRLLDEGMEARLTLLCAPAGYGKSTALSEWARRHDRLAAWVSLDKQDDDWVQFWTYVTAAIQEKVPGFGRSVWPLIEQGPSASLTSPEPAIQAMLNELDRITAEFAIVLDDVHLIELPAIYKSLIYLLERLPARIHFYIASRTELPLPTARLLARGDLRRITVQDLRFGPEEGLVFFRDTTNLALTREQVAKLCDQTEGWISGLKLAAISLAGSGNIAESIRRFSGHHHHISDYLLEEVYGHLSDDLRAFLLRTSILNRLNDSLCQAVSGQTNSKELLEKLTQANLFIIPLDDRRNWYRYHHLLSEFLQKRFANEAAPECAKAHVHAANWLERHGFEEEAAEHYLAGEQYEDVVRLIEKNLYLLSHKKSATLSRWMLQVPDRFLEGKPMLEIFNLHIMLATRHWADVPRKVEQVRIRYEAKQSRMNDTERKQVMGNIYGLCAVSAYIQKDLERLAEHLARADHYLPSDSLIHTLGHNKHFGLEEFDDHLSFINDHHGAGAFLQKIIGRWGPDSDHPLAIPMFASYGKLLYEWNRLEEAAACVGQVLETNDQPSIPRNLFHLYIAAARIQQGLGNPARAAELIEQLKLLIDSPDYEVFMRKIDAEQAWLFVRQGDIEYGAQWLQRCEMSSGDDVSLGSVFEHLALARVLGTCGRSPEALILLDKLYALLAKEDRLRDRVKVKLLQSKLLHLTGRKEQAQFRLDAALRLAQPEGFVRSFMDEGAVMAELLSEYVQANPDASERIDYARHLLEAFPTLEQRAANLTRVQVCCFDRFQLRVGDGDKSEIKWRTAKTEELMAFLVHYRGEPVPRDIILENLWEAVDAEKAASQFNTTVYYLRKNLGAIGLEGIVNNVRGDYSIQTDRLDCDVDEFRQCLAAGLPIADGKIKAYEEKLEKVYQTGYLHRNDYPWAEQRRIRLESDYARTLLQIYEHYAQERDFSSAIDALKKILAFNPLSEDIHVKLIRLHMMAGDRVSAMNQYKMLKHMLQSEFGVAPHESVGQLLQL